MERLARSKINSGTLRAKTVKKRYHKIFKKFHQNFT